jgi:uncharacterized protein YjbI with pentapeptide repeats
MKVRAANGKKVKLRDGGSYTNIVHEYPFQGLLLASADFSGSHLKGTTFCWGYTMSNTTSLVGCNFSSTTIENFSPQRETKLVDFSKCNFTNAKILNLNFRWCDFREANFAGADISNCTFERCNFSYTNFTNAKADGRKFKYSYDDWDFNVHRIDNDMRGGGDERVVFTGITIPFGNGFNSLN